MNISVDCRLLSNGMTGIARFTIGFIESLLSRNDLTVTLIITSDDNITRKRFGNGCQYTIHNIDPMSIKNLWIKIPGIWDVFFYPHFNAPLVVNAKNKFFIVHDLKHIRGRFGEGFKYRLKQLFNVFSIRLSLYANYHLIPASKFTGLELKYLKVKALDRYPQYSELKLRNRFMSSEEDLMFVYVGDGRKHKNVHHLFNFVRNWNKLTQKKSKLILVGSVCELEFGALDIDVQKLGSLSDEELVILLERNVCMLYLSEFEGFGLPVLEAIQNQIPIIVKDLRAYMEFSGPWIYRLPKTTQFTDVEIFDCEKWLDELPRCRVFEQHSKFSFIQSQQYISDLLNSL